MMEVSGDFRKMFEEHVIIVARNQGKTIRWDEVVILWKGSVLSHSEFLFRHLSDSERSREELHKPWWHVAMWRRYAQQCRN